MDFITSLAAWLPCTCPFHNLSCRNFVSDESHLLLLRSQIMRDDDLSGIPTQTAHVWASHIWAEKKRTARLDDCMHQFHLQGLSVQKNFADFVIDLISLFDICRHIEYIDISPWQILGYPKWRKIICKSCQSIVRASVSLWKNHKTGRTTHTELIAKASNNFFAAEKENLHFIAHFCSTWPIRHSLSLRIYCRQKSRILWCASFLRLLYANAKGLQLLIVLHAREGELNPCMSPCSVIWSHVWTPARLTPAIQ